MLLDDSSRFGCIGHGWRGGGENNPKNSGENPGVFGLVEKRFPGPEKFTRKEPRKVFGSEKFSGLLRNPRLDETE